ncbi:MAG: DNA recombination protein RmuC [Clostridia bacterium]|nr:DNA recombination protein RmuC [Clostridia bacterium]
MTEIRKDNNEKLDKINESVNEKLRQTLEEKLKDSFKSVVEGIGDVNKAVGEIKGLATDVGSLKNVLTNVKTKGILGEVILGNIIREFLTAGQFEENVATKEGSGDRVEFAVRLPGKDEQTVWLPVDSKFPYESYSILHDSADPDAIADARKRLRTELLKYAKDVSDKYIDVPNTTDFAVIFLPLEGLYLEALNLGLFEEIQSKYKVNLTGPTTFTAFINALNMGFRSLLIEKKSADVFKLLGAVKTEFGKFADALERRKRRSTPPPTIWKRWSAPGPDR